MHTVCRWILALAHQATAALDLRTLIVGETGTGKELVAKAIYRLGMNNVGPFAALNCGGFPLELIDTELFGHKRGAFTSAVSDHVGVLQRANGGILFLDEIGELPLHLQVKLLRVLEERTFSPVGSSSVIPFSAQVISATNRRLDEAVRTGEFRSDLYFRVAQFTVLLPALRDRRDDVILLIENFLGEHDLTIDAIDQELLTRMVSYDWPGNIRELRSAIDRLVLLQRTGLKVDFHDWQIVQSTEPGQGFKEFATLADLRENFDRKVLEEVLSRHKGDTNLAAQELGITRRSVYNLARRYGVNLKKVSED
ncbi:MAG TPA: sigma-54 dependent transcriptional regulator [Pyrinomonadaceae bacterium]|nr:sigma-54 dependent transcriptional regulator [Pyrinomonadaceae bacterium]